MYSQLILGNPSSIIRKRSTKNRHRAKYYTLTFVKVIDGYHHLATASLIAVLVGTEVPYTYGGKSNEVTILLVRLVLVVHLALLNNRIRRNMFVKIEMKQFPTSLVTLTPVNFPSGTFWILSDIAPETINSNFRNELDDFAKERDLYLRKSFSVLILCFGSSTYRTFTQLCGIRSPNLRSDMLADLFEICFVRVTLKFNWKTGKV